MGPPVNNNNRPATAAAPAQNKTAVPQQDPATTAEIGKQQATQKAIEGKPADKVTAQDRSDYADARATEKLLESNNFIGFLGKNAAEKLSKKMDTKLSEFLAANPNATPAQIKEFVDSTFKKELGSATASKFVVDMAISQMQQRLQEMQDDIFKK